MATFHSVIAPDHHHLAAIGRIVVLWTFVEHSIESLVWELANLKQPYAQSVTTHLQTLALIDMSKTLLNQHFAGTDLEERSKTLLNRIANQLRVKRNMVVHGIWSPTGTPEKISIMQTTARGILNFKVGEEMTSNDILDIAAEIDECLFQLTKLSFEVSNALQTKLSSP
ncbi:hypothetical protein [Pseudanabaena yagii]|uniref:RiboL-PSP-HEPN domain-containing protein n=1 Tax=Pseudanabaena yagii GIHE-NHR1 TaxID=2722753 RepID=A0ABX1LTM4_9CYAN|nr:hypothetical protein [Pseudanabaena yagii]NMF58361.1 hypothetical protein [Pseudanabaena yagii GIHE-NHR1]